MDRIAVFVDAGYFWVQCSQLLYGEKRPRSSVILDTCSMRQALLDKIPDWLPNSSLLRIYWYDGLGHDNQPTAKHREIAMLDDFKIRYGTINSDGKQKAVDGLIIADLLQLAQNKAVNSALIISGDADLAPGVTAAQMLGVRIHLLEIGPKTSSSPNLLEAVDRKYRWDDGEVHRFIKRNEIQLYKTVEAESIPTSPEYNQNLNAQNHECEIGPETSPNSSEIKSENLPELSTDSLEHEKDINKIIAEKFIATLTPEQVANIKTSGTYLEYNIDKTLINFAVSYLRKRWIDPGQLIDLRLKVKAVVCQS